MNFFSACRVLVLSAMACILISSCATRGRVDERYEASTYSGALSYSIEPRHENPQFIAYGDTQSGWRVNEKFLRRENWITPKAFIFPFFQIYTVVQGAVGSVNYLRDQPDYGGVERRLVRDAVYERTRSGDTDFILSLGDICANDGRRPKHWKLFYDENLVDVPLASEVPYVTTPGNHDRVNDAENGMPNYRSGFSYPQFFVLSYPDVAIFVIDSNVILDQYQAIADDEQDALFKKWIHSGSGSEPAWLQRQLAKYPSQFKIVAMHHPPVSVGRHTNDWDRTDWGNNLPEKRLQFLDVLFDEGVDVVMAGHEHNYQHLEVRREHDAIPLHIIVSSGGGAPVRSFVDSDEIDARCKAFQAEGLNVRVVKRAEVHHYTVVKVDHDTITFATHAVPAQEGAVETVILKSEDAR